MRKKFKLLLLGEPSQKREEIGQKISKFFDIPIYDLNHFCKSKKNIIDEDLINELRYKLSLFGENKDSFILNNIFINDELYECLGDLDLSVFLKLDLNKIIEFNQDRRWCPTCFKIYHLKKDPPLKEGLCNRCGSKIIIRDFDKPEIITRIYNLYDTSYFNLKNFYKGKEKLLEINYDTEIDDVVSEIIKKINQK